MLPNGGKVLPITAHLTNYAHYIRAKGFQEVIRSDFPKIELLPLQACFDNDAFAYEITKMTLVEHPDLAGVYSASNGTQGVCRAIDEAGLTGKIRVFTYDSNPPNVMDLREGRITLLIDQGAKVQGYRAMHILYDYLAKKQIPEKKSLTLLTVVTKYNIDESENPTV